jgi:hypothetical protein
VQGDRTLRTVRCRTCGIATHWEPLVPNSDNRHGVNLNNFDPALLAQVEVRRFDGADTWTFLDEGRGLKMSNLHRIFAMKFSAVYPLYVQKAEKKGVAPTPRSTASSAGSPATPRPDWKCS